MFKENSKFGHLVYISDIRIMIKIVRYAPVKSWSSKEYKTWPSSQWVQHAYALFADRSDKNWWGNARKKKRGRWSDKRKNSFFPVFSTQGYDLVKETNVLPMLFITFNKKKTKWNEWNKSTNTLNGNHFE